MDSTTQMEIKKLDKVHIDEFIELIAIFKEVFENNSKIPNIQHLENLLSNPDFLVFVAKVNDKVVGGLTSYILHQYYSEKPLAYIYDVGILPDFQRRGIGKALIAYVCSFCKETGFEDAYVEAETDDIEAVRFYRNTNYSNELQATHFTYSFEDVENRNEV